MSNSNDKIINMKSKTRQKEQTITTPSSVWVGAQLPVPSTLPLCHWSPDRPAVPQQRWWALPRLFWLLGSLHQSGRGGLHSLVPSENVMPNLNVLFYFMCHMKKKYINLPPRNTHPTLPFCVLLAFLANRRQRVGAEPSSSSGSSCHTWWWAPTPIPQVVNRLKTEIIFWSRCVYYNRAEWKKKKKKIRQKTVLFGGSYRGNSCCPGLWLSSRILTTSLSSCCRHIP